MDSLVDFFSFRNANTFYVVFGSAILAASTALVGTFSFLKKKSLAGDAVAHAVLPGICLAFLLSGNKNPLWLILGAFISGWFALVSIDFITSRTRLKEDTAIGLVMSVYFGVGIVLLTSIQHSGNAAQTGLEGFLFGKAAALVGSDMWTFAGLSVLLLLTVVLFFKELTLISFDENFAKVIGFPVRRLELLLTTLTVLAVVAGIQTVGVVLTAAMLITPAAAARFWTDRLPIMMGLAALIGAFSGISGAFASYLAPAMPTGPWIVLVASAVAIGSFLFAPGRGTVAKWQRQRAHRRKFGEENLLKLFYKLGENDAAFFVPRSQADILRARAFDSRALLNILARLVGEGYLRREGAAWQLTPEGRERGQRITRLHRLWELYLTEYLRLAPDHVHDDAETMEHIITPEIELQLEKRLKHPQFDPHLARIPYD